ncbi:MAG: phage-shock protein [Paenibacillaceae bacterium]|jgi:phage shock protein PspC (stress-responsive transcriptional regulator)|nr:phage-shock protein [Paenibacillaceae bacterium]
MRLERSRTDAKLFGLCGGIAGSLGVNPAWVRACVAVGVIFSGGLLLLVYVLAAMMLPVEEPQQPGRYMYVPSSRAYGFSGAEPAAAPEKAWSSEKEALAREILELRSRLDAYEQKH